jgi:hypothetical protein
VLDSGLNPETVKAALAQIDALTMTLGELKRQKDAHETATRESTPTGSDT